MKEILQFLGLFVAYAIWRLNRSKRFAMRLIDALGDEAVNELAGMLLTKGLSQTDIRVPLLLRKRQQLPNFFIVLASTENKDYIEMMEPYTRDPDASVSDAARVAIRILSA